MKIAFYQLFITLLAIIYIFDRARKFAGKEYRQSLLKFLVILCIWLSILAFIWFPNLAHSISRFFGMGENLNTLIFIGFTLVFALIYKLLTIIERMENEITKIVRQEALKKLRHD